MHSPWQSTVLSFPGKWGQLHLVSLFFGPSPSLLSGGVHAAALGELLPTAIPPLAAVGTTRPWSAL